MIGKLRLLFWIGVLMLFVPYLGITSGFKTVLTIVLGILVIYLTFGLRRGYKQMRYQMRRTEQPENITVETIAASPEK